MSNAGANFAIFYGGDAYSTENNIMGRQSAGKAFMRGVARTWPDGVLHGVGRGLDTAQRMAGQLVAEGFSGELRWHEIPDWHGIAELGALYYPAPTAKDFAFSRNTVNPAAFSLMGVTFTLSSRDATDQVSDLVLPPFKPWDALICISRAGREFVTGLQSEMRDWMSAQTGATRLNTPQLPVIPLGVDVPSFVRTPEQRRGAREALGLRENATVFLFAGRLSIHAKANPAPMYQALEQTARHGEVVCIEAGVFPNDRIRQYYFEAQKVLAPSVRFIWVDGKNELAYRQAWQGADVFVSLSDNIQETFGLTPVEAMAAGLPVVISDWNGYKETVRDGVDGFRVPTILPPAGTGKDLALRHALEIDSYDLYIGRSSMATVVDPGSLAKALTTLASQPALRAEMGAAGAARAVRDFDWTVILPRYAELASELAVIRRAAGAQPPEPWLQRADPFSRFASFSTAALAGNWLLAPAPEAQARLRDLLGLSMVNYAFDPVLLPQELAATMLAVLEKQGVQTVNALLETAGQTNPVGVRMLMWLWKFDLIRVQPKTDE